MTAVFVTDAPAGSDAWHGARRRGLGGSEVAAAAGLSPFESRFSLYFRKRGDVDPIDVTPEIEWGTRLEPAIIGKFCDEHPQYTDEGTRGMWRHPERPWQLASPDRLLYLPRQDGDVDLVGLLETKFSVMGDGWGEPGTDEVPIHVRIQTMWYLDCFGLPEANIAVLVGGLDYREYRVAHDPVEAGELRTIAEDFLADVEADRRPDIDAHSATYQVLKELHPDIDLVDVELTPDTAQRYILAKGNQRLADEAATYATSLVADEMGTAKRALWDGRTIARRQVRGDGFPFVVAARGLGADPEDLVLAGATGATWTDPEGREADF